MSNFANLRAQVFKACAVMDKLPPGVEFKLFDQAYEKVGGDESKVLSAFEGMVREYLAPPVPVSVRQQPLPAPAPILPMLTIDAAALAVIIDSLNCGSLFDAQARRTVRDELLVEMRRLDIAIAVKTQT